MKFLFLLLASCSVCSVIFSNATQVNETQVNETQVNDIHGSQQGDRCVSSTGTYVILNNEDTKPLENCSYLAGNLFIHGGLELDNLDYLKNLEVISGNLVISNNQDLEDLRGLHNIKTIMGNNTYLDQYVLYIKDNFIDSHIHDDNYNKEGLCYVDTINWDLIFNNITGSSNNWLISDNGVNCSSCHVECDGCFSSGPRYCQSCMHYKSGDTCVLNCPVGTTQEGTDCLESVPGSPTNISLTPLNKTTISVQWDSPASPNGVILGYQIYMNDSIIYTSNSLLTSYISTNLNPNTVYSYSVRARTSVGYGNYSDIETITTPEDLPPKPYPPVVTILDANSINISWTCLDNISGTLLSYEFQLFRNNMAERNVNSTHEHYLIIEDLEQNSSYSIRMKAYTNAGDGPYSDYTFFSTPRGIPLAPQNLVGYPLSSTDIHFSWDAPIETNGEMTNYSYEVYRDNIIYEHKYTGLVREANVSYLNSYTAYNITVQGYTRNGGGDYSDYITVRTRVGVPPVPQTPVILLNNLSLHVFVSPVSDINGPISLYEIYLLNLDTNIETMVYSNETINSSYTHHLNDTELSNNCVYLENILDYDTNYSCRLRAYTSDSRDSSYIYYSVSNYSNIIRTELLPTTSQPTTLPSTMLPTTFRTTVLPERKESSDQDGFFTDEVKELFIVLGGVLSGILCVILGLIYYCKKKNISQIDTHRRRTFNQVFNNPVYMGDITTEDDTTVEEETEIGLNIVNQIEESSDNDYLEISGSQESRRSISDAGHRLSRRRSTSQRKSNINELINELKTARLVPKNMLNDD